MSENVAVTAAPPARGARSWSPARANIYEGGAAALSIAVGAAAYFDAWTYVNNPSGYSSIGPWQDLGVVVTWLGGARPAPAR